MDALTDPPAREALLAQVHREADMEASRAARPRAAPRPLSRLKLPPAGTIPEAPGSYQFKDQHGRIIYVGKAKSLRKRVSSYFTKRTAARPPPAR